MPYKIEKVGKGYFVSDNIKRFSKKPLTKKMAEKQRIAIALSEHNKSGKPVSFYFYQ